MAGDQAVLIPLLLSTGSLNAEDFFNRCRQVLPGALPPDSSSCAAVAPEHLEGDKPAYRATSAQGGAGCARRSRRSCRIGLANPFEDLHRDLRNVVHALRAHLARPTRARPSLQIQVLGSLFFRNKAAYIVGKAMNSHVELPFAVPILQNEHKELYLDTLLLEQHQLLVLFSLRTPFLCRMMCGGVRPFWKLMRRSSLEMYMAVGLHNRADRVLSDLHYT